MREHGLAVLLGIGVLASLLLARGRWCEGQRLNAATPTLLATAAHYHAEATVKSLHAIPRVASAFRASSASALSVTE